MKTCNAAAMAGNFSFLCSPSLLRYVRDMTGSPVGLSLDSYPEGQSIPLGCLLNRKKPNRWAASEARSG